MLAFHIQATRAIFQRCVLQISVVNESHYQSTIANVIIVTIINKTKFLEQSKMSAMQCTVFLVGGHPRFVYLNFQTT